MRHFLGSVALGLLIALGFVLAGGVGIIAVLAVLVLLSLVPPLWRGTR